MKVQLWKNYKWTKPPDSDHFFGGPAAEMLQPHPLAVVPCASIVPAQKIRSDQKGGNLFFFRHFLLLGQVDGLKLQRKAAAVRLEQHLHPCG